MRIRRIIHIIKILFLPILCFLVFQNMLKFLKPIDGEVRRFRNKKNDIKKELSVEELKEIKSRIQVRTVKFQYGKRSSYDSVLEVNNNNRYDIDGLTLKLLHAGKEVKNIYIPYCLYAKSTTYVYCFLSRAYSSNDCGSVVDITENTYILRHNESNDFIDGSSKELEFYIKDNKIHFKNNTGRDIFGNQLHFDLLITNDYKKDSNEVFDVSKTTVKIERNKCIKNNESISFDNSFTQSSRNANTCFLARPINKRELYEGISDDTPLNEEELQVFKQERKKSSNFILKVSVVLFCYLIALWVFVLYKYFRKAIHKRGMKKIRKELVECNNISDVVSRSNEIERIRIRKNRLDRLLIIDNLLLRNKWVKLLKFIFKNRF